MPLMVDLVSVCCCSDTSHFRLVFFFVPGSVHVRGCREVGAGWRRRLGEEPEVSGNPRSRCIGFVCQDRLACEWMTS